MLGWPEILLVFAVLLLVMGPSKLPEMAKALGTAIREFQRATTTMEQETKKLETQLTAAANTLPPLTQPALVAPVSPAPVHTPASAPAAAELVPTIEEDRKGRISEIAKTLGISSEDKTEEQLRSEIMEALDGQKKKEA
jgi:TatA/E family protein of Tat protein translocase